MGEHDETSIIPLRSPAENRDFDIVLRGYDRGQVDQYVAALELRVRRAEIEAGRQRPSYESLGARVAQILSLAEQEAAEMRAAGRSDADELREQAARDTAASTQLVTERRRAAETEAAEILAQAREEAARIMDDARASAAAAVERANEELADLTAQRDAIRDQLERLREQLNALVAQARSTGEPVIEPEVLPAEPATGRPSRRPDIVIEADDLTQDPLAGPTQDPLAGPTQDPLAGPALDPLSASADGPFGPPPHGAFGGGTPGPSAQTAGSDFTDSASERATSGMAGTADPAAATEEPITGPPTLEQPTVTLPPDAPADGAETAWSLVEHPAPDPSTRVPMEPPTEQQ